MNFSLWHVNSKVHDGSAKGWLFPRFYGHPEATKRRCHESYCRDLNLVRGLHGVWQEILMKSWPRMKRNGDS